MAKNSKVFEVEADDNESRMWFVNEDQYATTHWKQQKIDDSLPLLDLNELWGSVSGAPDTTSAEKFASALCEELKQYLWSQTIPDSLRGNTGPEKIHFAASPDERIAAAEKFHEKKIGENEEERKTASTLGEPLLFKLRCENKKPKKNVPNQSPAEQTQFLIDILAHLSDIKENKAHLFPVVISTFGFEMTPFFYARLVEALELNNEPNIDATRSILRLFADYANAKEMHMVMKTTIAKINTDSFEGMAFYTMCDLLELWGRVVNRMKKSRSMCMYDVFSLQERMLPCVEGFVSSFGLQEESDDPGGLKTRYADIILGILNDLLDTQEELWSQNIHLQDAVYKDGEPVKSRCVSVRRVNGVVKYLEVTENEILTKDTLQVAESTPMRSSEDAVIDDWVLERRYILLWALALTRHLLEYLPCPVIDKEVLVLSATQKAGDDSMDGMTERLDALLNIFVRLGWTNPVRAAQLVEVCVQRDSVRRCADVLIGEGLGPIIQFCKNTKTTKYSLASFAAYLFLALRVKGSGGTTGLFDMSLEGSGFDFLEPTYAFEIALPYIMNLVDNSFPAVSLIGVRIADLFLERVNRNWKSCDVLRLRSGAPAMPIDVSVYGFIGVLGKILECLGDPGHIMFVYRTLKNCIAKIECAVMRYSIMNMLLVAAGRTAIAAQYVTCLKDVLDFANKHLDKAEDKGASLIVSDNLRTRFVETVYPKYLSPRKDYLSLIDPIVATSASVYFVTLCDKKWLENSEKEQELVRAGVTQRLKFSKQYIEVGRECVRALAAASEHDIKSIPASKTTKKEYSKVKAIFEAAKVSLNHSVSAVSTLTAAMDILKEMQSQIDAHSVGTSAMGSKEQLSHQGETTDNK